ncbi:Gfo/Idh/MocA family protein [Candidatus Hakubella thermalkaliphila]|uniref:Gfo/Idh/MocA family oxidoreductase n=1 Tax=Candidatus Hakubella thermalkaliphila TaxID=2754717 RepID=A0A6V8P693_9ACTN|nr:Gfo/Idh/MocA family oxidoreductase [Candidatus Hakubella thermalkaliphila]GFP28172.1 hypothetical protein HKBW3S33_01589 [Candidatus Hakubella thermalkaliphila]GFP43695.1 hypothetical protein HKBW3C_02824 [Candidatus Hakubella thermalkaliphila]
MGLLKVILCDIIEAQVVNVGVIGCGHWGPNHIRIFSTLADSRVTWATDLSSERLEFIKTTYPQLSVSADYKDVLKDSRVHAIVIATSAATHYEIVKDCLESEKDVLCEKPLTCRVEESEELVDLAERKKKILMVGHTFLFNTGIQKLKDYVRDGTLGKVYYVYSRRVNLGPIRNDVNVIWDLASHDISIFHYLFGTLPIEVSAKGESFLQDGLEDVAFISLTYPDSVLANAHVSWLDPRKVREITIVGDKKMVIWDDLNPEDTIRLYERGVAQEPYYKDFGEFQLIPKEGDVTIPKLLLSEPLRNQDKHFIECVKRRVRPLSDGVFGSQVVQVLEAAQKSLRNNGEMVKIK